MKSFDLSRLPYNMWLHQCLSVLFQFFETRVHILCESSSGSSTSISISNGHGYNEILLLVRVGVVRILLR